MSIGRFYVLGILGAAMVGLSIALVASLAFGIGTIGSCSSTGYSGGRAVPVCSASDVFKIVGIFPAVGLGLVGMFVASLRAPRELRGRSFKVATWTAGYLAVGAALIASGHNPASDAEGADRWGWMIPGYLFVVMGLIGGVVGLTKRSHSRIAMGIASRVVPSQAQSMTALASVLSQVRDGQGQSALTTLQSGNAEALARLEELHRQGVLTQSELDAARSRLPKL